VKVLARKRSKFSLDVFHNRTGPKVAFVGCGHFAYSTLAHFLHRHAQLVSCYDKDLANAEIFSARYGIKNIADNINSLLSDPEIELVYVASNHASHAFYGCAALKAGKDVYIEKPVAVSIEQLNLLKSSVISSNQAVYSGYNRPFAKAIKDLRHYLPSPTGPLTLSCFISGHQISPHHWYRDAEEGTRICGNVGHWIDLAIHLLHWREAPSSWKISLIWSNEDSRDDDLSINLVSNFGDLITIVLTSRCEPFEGINETLNLQWNDLIAKIDDFRRMDIWAGERHIRRRYWPKDAGHKKAALQPFRENKRNWQEIEMSSLITIFIAEMVVANRSESEISIS
jgi:predicted dehydrogenase